MTDFSAGNVRPTAIAPTATDSTSRAIPFASVEARPTSLDDRRRRPRRGHHDEHQVTVVDGPLAGERFGCVYREVTPESSSLLVKADLGVGQRVRVQPLVEGLPTGTPIQAEILRSRLLTTGRYEVLIEHRRPPAEPKMSESQRRHERRQARLAANGQANGLPVNRTI